MTNPSNAQFEPGYGQWQPGMLAGAHLARVARVDDPEGLARVQVELLNLDSVAGQEALMWARVAVSYAGANMGAFFIPNVGDEVLVTFVNGDPRFPIVLGGLWNGSATPPETLGGSGDSVDRWSFTGKYGSRVAIVEESAGQSTIEISTPGQVKATLEETGGGKLRIETPGGSITIDSSGVKIETSSNVTVQASRVSVSAAQVSVDSALATFSGMIQCQTLQASSVISASYSPGAGNIW